MKTEPKISRPAQNDAPISLPPSREWPVIVALCAALAFLYYLTAQPLPQSDPASRNSFGLTAALATEGSSAIDHYLTSPVGGFLTSNADVSNVAYFAGHYYSDSPPGAAFLMVPFYLLGRLFGDAGPAQFGLAGLALAGAVTVLTVYSFARRMGAAVVSARYAALTLGLASVLWREAGRAGPGVFTALALALALWLAVPPLPRREEAEGGPRLQPGRAVLLGLVLGFAGVVDYPNLVWTPLFGLYLLAGRRVRWPGALALAGGWLAGVLPLALYNWASFERPWAFAYGFLLDDEAARSLAGQFLGGFSSNNLNIVRETFFGANRGLLGPFVVFLGVWGLTALYGQRGKRRETLLAAALIGVCLGLGLLRRPVGSGPVRADFVLGMLPPLSLGVAVWHERFLFLTRLEQWWLPGLTLAGTGLYYWLAAPGPFANLPGLLYLLPVVVGLAGGAGLWRGLRRLPRPVRGLGLAGLLLALSAIIFVASGPSRPAVAANGASNLIYNDQLSCENGLRAGWYLGEEPFRCTGGEVAALKPGQSVQPYKLPVQGGKVYRLRLEGQGTGRIEWRWMAEPVLIDGAKFLGTLSRDWKGGAYQDSRAAPPGAAYLQLVFTVSSAASLNSFRLADDGVRVEPMRNYATAALSFTFDWESAMGGLIHSIGGAPGVSEAAGVSLSEENLRTAIADAERRGNNMRQGADYLLALFKRYDVRGTFYATGYNLLDGNRDKLIFAGNPTYRWANESNGWASNYWTTHPWYGLDPYGDFKTDPAWYFGDQTERMRGAGQDVQSHTFGHLYVRGTTVEEFSTDIETFVRFARTKNLAPIRHFAFPWTSSNSVTAQWYAALADRGFQSITRLYYTDQGKIQDSLGGLKFDNGKRASGNKISYDEWAGPTNDYYLLRRVKGEPRLLALSDYEMTSGEKSEATARTLIDELLRRRGYGSIWTHPESVVNARDQGQWLRVVNYATQKREAGLWVDSVSNIVQHRLDTAQVGVETVWREGGKRASLTLTNGAKNPVEGLTLTLPGPLRAASGALSFKGPQLLVPTLQPGQRLTIEIELG